MLVSEVLQYIKDAVSTKDDIMNKSIQPLFNNKLICRQLNLALHRYASYTKGIEDYHSLPVGANTPSILLPSDIIRTEGLRFLIWFINGCAYPIKDKNLNNTWGNFPVPIQGLPSSMNVWKDRINFYPQNSAGYNTATLKSNITETDTTIPVNDKSQGVFGTSGFPTKNGRFTLENEIIEYDYTSNGSFYGCRRGQEDTTAASHTTDAIISENNVWIYYYRLHFPITVQDDNSIDDNILNKKMLVADDHLEIIIKYTAYNLLSKLDTQRAVIYKTDWEEWLKDAKREINKGRCRISKTGEIRQPYPFETQTLWRT